MDAHMKFICSVDEKDVMVVYNGDDYVIFEINDDDNVVLTSDDVKRLRKFLRGEPSPRRKAAKRVIKAALNYAYAFSSNDIEVKEAEDELLAYAMDLQNAFNTEKG